MVKEEIEIQRKLRINSLKHTFCRHQAFRGLAPLAYETMLSTKAAFEI